MQLINRDGKTFDALVIAIPIQRTIGEPEALVLYAEVPLRTKERRAAPWLQAIEHELKGTLQALSLTISVLKPGNVINDQRRELLQRNIRLLGRLVEDLIDTVLINQGNVLYRPARIQLTELVRQLLDLASQVDHRHSFRWSAPLDLEVFADLDRLQQIISNLLTNALKYSASGTLELGGRLDTDRVLLWIRDQGPGISEKDQQVLFHPYSRLPSREEGSGLGLWIARELARHGRRSLADQSIGREHDLLLCSASVRRGVRVV